MSFFPKFRFIAVIAIATTFTACADYLSDDNTNNGNFKIGLPGGVNVVNSEISNAKSRSTTNAIPNIHYSSIEESQNPLFCRYTTTPGINTRKNNRKVNTIANTRGIAITTNSFYDSYSLYSYIYPSKTTWAATTSTSGSAYDETYFDEEIKMAKSWTTDEFWPGGKEKCAFFAYAPYHAKGLSKFNTNSWPSFHYSVPTDVTEQSDLLVTKNEIPSSPSAYGNIDISGSFNKPDSITFDHACTAIRFAIGDQMAPGVIKKISICNVYSAGDYNYETESWSNVDSLKTFTLTQDFEIKSGEHNKILNNDDNIFMMLPQILPSKATIEITINDGTERVIKAYLRDDEWKKGYTVTYYLSTAKVESSYVLSMAPASGNIPLSGGTKAVTIYSYKQTYYGSQIPVPWTASYSYDDPNDGTSPTYNVSTAVVPGFVASGNGSTTGESTNFQVASQVARSKSWRSAHTQTLRNVANGSCDLAAGKQTANCYVIQAPGTYTFPLVYGNALNADGSSNDNSYKTATFVDHNGIQINSPYIYSTNGGTNVPYDACIVWQDAPHLVTPSSVQLTSDKHSIQFTVERKNICAGNCVIAVRDKDQNIMWSWHIWVTDHNMNNTIEVHNNPSVGGSVISNFMEVPLGWCDAEIRVYDKRTFHLNVKQTESGSQSATTDIIQLSADSTYEYGVNAPYYQWGRKDPMLASNGMGNIDKPYYDNQYIFLRPNAQVTTKEGILYPYNMYYVYNSNWSTSTNIEYWNKGNSVMTVNNNKIYKTIYSPSPTNYAEPKSAAFTGFTTTGGNTTTSSQFNITGPFNSGWNFYSEPNFSGLTVFFQALGYRATDTGKTAYILGVSTRCCYWTASPASNTTFRLLTAESNSVYPITLWDQCAGANIRPVLDQ